MADTPHIPDETETCARLPRHCERSEAIHVAAREPLDCRVALLLAMTEGV
jgi:hypothetical protein